MMKHTQTAKNTYEGPKFQILTGVCGDIWTQQLLMIAALTTRTTDQIPY